MIHDEAEARRYCAELGDADALDRLERLEALLKSENREQNLIAKASEDSIWLRHFADSAQLLDHVSSETSPWLDLGTGAGFPGLVISALRPSARVILVESRRRRADWLARAAEALRLSYCVVEPRRLENVADLQAGIISARAFAPLPKLLRLSARFSTRDTVWLLPKGRSARQEVASLPVDLARMFHVEPSVTDREAGILVGRGQPRIA
jgi:16S rRNA (guanine527-N7)-methyltransferase